MNDIQLHAALEKEEKSTEAMILYYERKLTLIRARKSEIQTKVLSNVENENLKIWKEVYGHKN